MNGAKRPFSDKAYKMLADFRAKKRAELGLADTSTSKAMQTEAPTAKAAHAASDDDDTNSCAFRLR